MTSRSTKLRSFGVAATLLWAVLGLSVGIARADLGHGKFLDLTMCNGSEDPSCCFTINRASSPDLKMCYDPGTGSFSFTGGSVNVEGLTVADGVDADRGVKITCQDADPPSTPTGDKVAMYCQADHVKALFSDGTTVDLTALAFDETADYTPTGIWDFSSGHVANVPSTIGSTAWLWQSNRSDNISRPPPFRLKAAAAPANRSATILAEIVDDTDTVKWRVDPNGNISVGGGLDGSKITGTSSLVYTVMPPMVVEAGSGAAGGRTPDTPAGAAAGNAFLRADGTWVNPIVGGGAGDVTQFLGNTWADDKIVIGKGTGKQVQVSQATLPADGKSFVLIRPAAGAGTTYRLDWEDATNGNNTAKWKPPDALAADAVYTGPAATDTLVGRATTDTLTNKTLTAASLGTSYLSTTKTADAAGVTAALIVKINSTGNVVNAVTSDTGILGIAATTATSGNPVEVATRGIANCVADNTTVVGDVLIVGTSTAGRCRDSGSTDATAIPSSTQIIGKALTVVSAGSNVFVQLYGPGHYGTQTVAHAHTSGTTGGTLTAAAIQDGVGVVKVPWVQTQTVTVTNTAGPTTLVGTGTGSNVLATNYFTAGHGIRVTSRGYYTTGVYTGSFTFKIDLVDSSSTRVNMATVQIAPGSSRTDAGWGLVTEVTCRTTGASGTVWGTAGGLLNTTTTGNGSVLGFSMTAAATIDTTKTQTVDVTITEGGTLSGSESVKLGQFVIETF